MAITLDNNDIDGRLSPPDDFLFPFVPYPIQKDFMKNLYTALEYGKLGIFESPTGTGKSQSLLCGSLRWLLDNENRRKSMLENQIAALSLSYENNSNSTTDWIVAQANNLKNQHEKYNLQIELNAIKEKEEKLKLIKKNVAENKLNEKKNNKYYTDDADKNSSNKSLEHNPAEIVENDNLQEELDNDELLEEKQLEQDDDKEDSENENKIKDVKIIISSRTHSQLSQLVNEVKRGPYSDSIRLVTLASRSNYCINPSVQKLNSLALINERCIELRRNKRNDKVTLKCNDSGIDKVIKRSRCNSTPGCSYLSPVSKLTDEIITSVMDVEDIVKEGKQLKACPYYATRSAIEDAQLVIIPYNILLHKATREACGLKLEGNVVIIDEAHNLPDTIQQVHSTLITSESLKNAYSQLTSYRDKYKKRFSPKNLLHLNQLIYIVENLIKFLRNSTTASNNPSRTKVNEIHMSLTNTKVYKLNDFLLESRIDNINVYDILKFCRNSKLSQKLQGFVINNDNNIVAYNSLLADTNKKSDGKTGLKGVEAFLKQIQSNNQKKLGTAARQKKTVQSDHFKNKVDSISNSCESTITTTTSICSKENETDANKNHKTSVGTNAIPGLLSLIECFTNPSEDGRIICTYDNNSNNNYSDKSNSSINMSSGSIKFLLLNTSSHFKDIVQQARSVIVAGGTMQPVSEFSERLFIGAGAPRDRVMHFSCGHVIPKESILPIALTNGPTNTQLDFSYIAKDSKLMLDELGRVLLNLNNVVPAGVVCFFTSYEYERTVYKHLEQSGVLAKISAKKKIFREPKNSNEVDKTLKDFAKTIKSASSDQNASSQNGALLFSVVGGKLSEGLNFSDDLGRCIILVGLPYPNIKSAELQEKMAYLNYTFGNKAGEEHYESLCMKAVNQTIGRAVRHKGDYATIWLLDKRYARETTQKGLPDWIRSSLTTFDHFGRAMGATARFFNTMHKKV